MNRDAKRDGRALRRIVMLLLALASLAERAAAMPFARRAVVFQILRHAEVAAWGFALGTACVSAARGRDPGRVQDANPPGAAAGSRDDPAGAARLAARLAVSLRMLALIVAGWAAEALSPSAAPSSVLRAQSPRRPGSSGGWRGPAALPAPDTS